MPVFDPVKKTGMVEVGMSPPITPLAFADDFNRANGALGPNWTAPNYTVTSNKARTTVNGPAIWNADTNTTRQYCDLDVDLTPGTLSGPMVRMSLVGGIQGYWAAPYPIYSTNPTEQYLMYRFHNGAVTVIGNLVQALPASIARIRITAEDVGADVLVQMYLVTAGVPALKLSYTDSHTSRKYHQGVGMELTFDPVHVSASTVDNWAAGDNF